MISYSQWEKTSWQSDFLLGNIWANDTYIVIQTSDGFLYSQDNGVNWELKGYDGIYLQQFSEFEFGNGIFYAKAGNQRFISKDLGDTWQEVIYSIGNYEIYTLAVKGDTLYGGTYGNGIFISTDEGNTWIAKNNGLNTTLSKHIFTIVFDGDKIAIGTRDGVYISTDFGENWTSTNNGLPNNIMVSYISINDDNIFIVAYDEEDFKFYHSTDIGNTWNKGTNEIYYRDYGGQFTSVGNDIFFTDMMSLHHSSDLGKTWQEITTLDKDNGILGMNGLENELYVSVGGDLYKTSDLGETWIMSRPKARTFGAVQTMQFIDGKLFIGARTGTFIGSKGNIYTSIDKGDTWTPNSINNSVHSLAFNNNNIIASTYGSLLMSTDYGTSWNKMLERWLITVFPLAYTGVSIFALDSRDVSLSTNNGITWEFRNNGLPDNLAGFNYLAIYDNDVFTCPQSNGIYLSTDRGMNWSSRNIGLPNNSDISTLIKVGNNLFSSVTGNVKKKGIYKSSNNGNFWEQCTNGLPLNPYVYGFYALENIIFASISDGIYISKDEGETWIKKSDGILKYTINNFADDGEYIYAATNSSYTGPPEMRDFGKNGDAIYRAKLSDFGISEVKENVQISELNINPNPTSDFITIQFSNKELQPFADGYKVQIFDVLGIEVMTESIHPMTSSHRMNVEKLQSGVYFIRIGNKVEKFVKM